MLKTQFSKERSQRAVWAVTEKMLFGLEVVNVSNSLGERHAFGGNRNRVLERNPQLSSPKEPCERARNFRASSLLTLTVIINAALDGGLENVNINQEVIISSISGAKSLQVKMRVLFSPRNSWQN